MEETLFLQKIRTALSQYSTEEEARVLSASERPSAGPASSLDEKLRRFAGEVAELHQVQIFRVRDWKEARKKLAEVLTERGSKSLALAGKDLEPSDPLWKKWGPVSELASVEKADVGVIQADYGL